jgi:neopullulanase
MPIDTPGWVRDAIFYQVFPDRFARSGRVPMPGPLEAWDAPPTHHGFKGGDLYGLSDRLPELRQLGVTALYLTPIFASASNHRYHTYDYLAVDPLLGGDAALRELLDRAHALGMRVVLDGVFNHSGRGFWPFHHVAENGAASPYRDWFILDERVLAGARRLDPYPAVDPVLDHAGLTTRGGYRAWWGIPALPKLNVANPHVREYLLGVGEHWLRFGIDGWRLDVPTEIEDPTFWPEFRRRCRAVDPEAYLVGEIWTEAPEWLTGDRFDALMNYPLASAILGFAAGASLDQRVVDEHHMYRKSIRRLDGAGFGREVERLMRNYDPRVVAVQLNLLGSHDAPRALTVMSGDVSALRLATTLQLTLPGAPCIYYGDEIAMAGHHDPDCRRAYPVEPGAGDQALRAYVTALTAARHDHAPLRLGDVRCIGSVGEAVVLERSCDGRRALVAVNAGRTAQDVPLDRMVDLDGEEAAMLAWRPLPGLVSDGVELRSTGETGATAVVRLPAQGSGVYLEA